MKNQIILAALLLSSSCAFAGNGYVGINAGSTTQRFTIDGDSHSEDTTGVRAYAGFQINPAFGIEGGYVHFGNVSAVEDGINFAFKPTSVYAAATGTMPMSPSLNLMGKVGIARSNSTFEASSQGQKFSADKTGTSAMFGIGVEYKFSETMSVVAEYENFGKIAKFDQEGINVKASMVSVGLRTSF